MFCTTVKKYVHVYQYQIFLCIWISRQIDLESTSMLTAARKRKRKVKNDSHRKLSCASNLTRFQVYRSMSMYKKILHTSDLVEVRDYHSREEQACKTTEREIQRQLNVAIEWIPNEDWWDLSITSKHCLSSCAYLLSTISY